MSSEYKPYASYAIFLITVVYEDGLGYPPYDCTRSMTLVAEDEATARLAPVEYAGSEWAPCEKTETVTRIGGWEGGDPEALGLERCRSYRGGGQWEDRNMWVLTHDTNQG